MADRHRDQLSFAAVIVGGACVVVVSSMLLAVLWTPAVPRPGGAATDAYSQAAAAALSAPQAPDRRDYERIPVTAETPGKAPAPAAPAAPAAAPDRSVAAPVAPAPSPSPPPVVEASTFPLKSDTSAPGAGTTDRGTIAPPGAPQSQRGLVILQLGDSHTAADYFTGELRARLQQRYGNGGVGYIVAGKPHMGVRSNTLKITASSGWTYRAIQRSDDVAQFWLGGFNAVASVSGEVLTFASDSPVPFDSIEIEALRQPGGGSIDISLDGAVKSSADLGGRSVEPVVLRLRPDGASSDRVRQIEIRTRGDGPVGIASVGIYQKQSGVSFNNIGYPGATIDLLNKFDATLMADDLRRLDPQIVVLAFGTNEASKPNLDAARYEKTYEKAIGRITAALPNAQIVLVGPPDGAERPPHCTGKQSSDVCHAAPAEGTAAPEPSDCDWHTIAHLDMVRDVERRIAERHGFTYWNWASIQPKECGSAQWVAASPPLMTPDHVHFTPLGYTKGADQFVDVLVPVIEKIRDRLNVATRG